MSYIVGGDIEASDYNQFVYQARRLIGDIYSGSITEDNGLSTGYGSETLLSEVSIGEIVTNEKWGELIDAIKTIGVHQGTSTTPPMPETNPADGDVVEVYDSPITFQILLDTLYGNRLSVDAGQYVDVAGTISQYNLPWTDLVEYTVDIDFGSWDNLRYFFNTGGSLSVIGNYTQGSSPTPVELQMEALLQSMSPLVIKAYKTLPDQGLNQSPNGEDYGIYNLPLSFPEYSTLYLQSFSGGAFAQQGIRVEGKIKNQPGTDGMITLRITLSDPDGEGKTGTLSFSIDHRKSSGVIPYNGPVDIITPVWYSINTPAPVVTSVTPASGPGNGDTSVTIRGLNFFEVATVSFGDTQVAGFSTIDQTTIRVLTPPGVVGSTVPVVVTTVNGSSNDNVTYTYTSSATTNLPIIATGGTIEDRLVGWKCYRYHTFTSSGTFNVLGRGTYSSNVDYLIISGGGGGGNNYAGAGAGGGGGAGSRFISNSEVFVQQYTVTVGAGGAAYNSGGSSSFMGHIVPGGGHGGQYPGTTAAVGASGGGAGQGGAQYNSPHTRTDPGANGTTGWGNRGGASIMYAGMATAGGGGGGGLGGVGGDTRIVSIKTKPGSPEPYWYAYINGGNGGAGVTTDFPGYTISICGGGGGAGCNRSSTARIYGWDTEYWYFTAPTGEAGSGGGATVNGSSVRSGGRGAVWGATAPAAGVAGTGGGGGGGNAPFTGAAGGSGIVSIRYLKCDLPQYDFDRGFVAARSLAAPRSGVTTSVLRDGRILSIGGTSSGGSNLVYAYNTYANTWTQVASLSTGREIGAGAGTLPDGRVLVWGGTSSNVPLSSSEIYAPSSNTWTAGTAYPIPCTEMAFATLQNGDLFSVGGKTTDLVNTNQAYIYRASSNTWQRVADCPESFSQGAASVLLDGRVIVCFNTRTYFYSPDTNLWESGPAFPVDNRSFGMITTPDGNVGAYGGTGSGARIFVYSSCCNAWGQAAVNIPISLQSHGVALSSNQAEVFTIGGISSGTTVSNVYRQTLKDVPPWSPIQATGGSVDEYTTTEGTYRVHTFTNVGNNIFSVQSIGSTDGRIDYLVVGGGGGGGSRGGGGGGGGGVITGVFNVGAQDYTVTVGAGGPGGQGVGARGTKGGNSVFIGVSAIGGGGGGSYAGIGNTGVSGGSGGSGGGGGGGDSGNNGAVPDNFATAGAAGARTVSQGNAGGGGVANVYTDAGGGGGGASTAGTNPAAWNSPGSGGSGRLVQLKTTDPIRYAGGGAGTGLSGAGGSAGAGGGGAAFSNGVDGLGGGGGGGFYSSSSGYGAGGRGGSGTVIIRYKITP